MFVCDVPVCVCLPHKHVCVVCDLFCDVAWRVCSVCVSVFVFVDVCVCLLCRCSCVVCVLLCNAGWFAVCCYVCVCVSLCVVYVCTDCLWFVV